MISWSSFLEYIKCSLSSSHSNIMGASSLKQTMKFRMAASNFRIICCCCFWCLLFPIDSFWKVNMETLTFHPMERSQSSSSKTIRFFTLFFLEDIKIRGNSVHRRFLYFHIYYEFESGSETTTGGRGMEGVWMTTLFHCGSKTGSPSKGMKISAGIKPWLNLFRFCCFSRDLHQRHHFSFTSFVT